MNCAEATATVQAYVDGELDGVDREAVERHLVGCPGCARPRARCRRASGRGPRPPAPARRFRSRLRRRIEEALASQPIAPRRWPAWMSYAAHRPGGGGGVPDRRDHRDGAPLAFDGAASRPQRSYHTEMPMDITGSDCGSIASWFRGRVEFPVHAPGAGRRRDLPGRPARQRRRAAGRLPRLPGPTAIASRSWCSIRATRRSSRTSVAWSTAARSTSAPGRASRPSAYRDRGLGYVVTADLDEDTLTRGFYFC